MRTRERGIAGAVGAALLPLVAGGLALGPMRSTVPAAPSTPRPIPVVVPANASLPETTTTVPPLPLLQPPRQADPAPLACPRSDTRTASDEPCVPYASRHQQSDATVECRDGTDSFAPPQRGACSVEGGVARQV
jgi:Protein of unknown function (DUF3761)